MYTLPSRISATGFSPAPSAFFAAGFSPAHSGFLPAALSSGLSGFFPAVLSPALSGFFAAGFSPTPSGFFAAIFSPPFVNPCPPRNRNDTAAGSKLCRGSHRPQSWHMIPPTSRKNCARPMIFENQWKNGAKTNGISPDNVDICAVFRKIRKNSN